MIYFLYIYSRDTIQRARYVAKDKSYAQWPPCLRIFHPFGNQIDKLAFDIAACIEEYQIESFEICLSEWSIIPHAEAMELYWWRSAEKYRNDQDDSIGPMLSPTQIRQLKEREELQNLIREQERRGWQNMQERRRKKGQDPLPESLSPVEMAKQERESTDLLEFDGPCVLCLEPDLESREDLMTLRSVLQKEGGMARFSPFSPTATADPSTAGLARFADFRPIIPIASFDTVSEAIPVAQKLRKLWEPLTFEVTDLQILASQEHHDKEERTTRDPVDNYIQPKSRTQGSQNLEKQCVMGCSALIMLYGEEMEMDDEMNSEIANLIAKTGEDGGFVQQQEGLPVPPTQKSPAPSSMDATPTWSADVDNLNLVRNGQIDDIEAYLAEDEEDDHDDGTVVVIGRVHFFSGNARQYQGMPADTTNLFVSPSATVAALPKTNKTSEGKGFLEG